ncbi:unnamed protein product [Linum trigynum]|uniref:Uncharacterized protein n=1 Tax=Linum trigynum TaxID=586398 RepID=A0AAV2DYA8_9ROSI
MRSLRTNLLSRDNLKFDGVIDRLIQEETRLRTQEKLDVRPGAWETVFSIDSSSDSAYAVNHAQFQRWAPTRELKCI